MLIEDHHPAYISFEKYLKNQELLANNAMMQARTANNSGAAREGEALLQGLVRCGRCGRTMSVGEAARRLGLSKSHVVYLIKTGRLEAMQVTFGTRRCWRINLESATCGRQAEMFGEKGNNHPKEA